VSTETNHPIIEYGDSVTDAALAELKKLYGTVPDASSQEGYDTIKANLKVLTPLRTGVEKKRKELKADALAWGKKVDDEAKRITAALLELESPLKDAKKEVDDRKRSEKEERIARLQKKVDAISAYPQTAFGQPSEVIEKLIVELKALEIEDFYDLSKEAAKAKWSSLETLESMYQTTIAQEEEAKRLAEQRAEMERQQTELREQQEALARQQEAMPASSMPAPAPMPAPGTERPIPMPAAGVAPAPQSIAPPPAASAAPKTAAPEMASNDTMPAVEARQPSQVEIDIARWLFDNVMIQQSHADAIAEALVSGRVPHIEAITTIAA